MTRDLASYRQLERRLWVIRWRHEGRESAEEDAILDEMEAAWMDLSDDDRGLLNHEGPTCWPMDSSLPPPSFTEVLYPPASTRWTYEGFHSPAEAILSADAA